MLLGLALLWQVRAGAAPLYEVSVNLDIEALAPEAGVTMMFEKSRGDPTYTVCSSVILDVQHLQQRTCIYTHHQIAP